MKKDKSQPESFSLQKRIRSFRHAINGIRLVISGEHNMRIHLFAAVLAITAGFFLRISSHDWMAISFAIAFVFATELFNSAIESLADFISPGHHDDIGKIKDISAGAVLVAAISAVITGVLVFWPHLKLILKF
ncbi:MAG TPA: diacylglycerol kinase family protein [Bacteroidia bacterium]|nr:diacylglycerol kinase family protein [Bacteroidia bacterium]